MSDPAATREGAILAPRANALLFGHGAAEAQLLSAMATGRPAHAWLLAGPRGIGKATLAYRFARYLLQGGGAPAGADLFASAAPSLTTPSLAADPGSAIFRRIAAGAHLDLMVIERGFDEKRNRRRSEIVVDDIRRVHAFLHRTAAEEGRRVVIVDCADEMNGSAANALLKVLEEPPAKAMLVLVSHAPGRLLPTLRSRCRRLDLKPLSDADMARALAHVRPETAPADKAMLVRLAAGSPGRALELALAGGVDLYGELVRIVSGNGGSGRGLDIPSAHAMAERLARRGETDMLALFFDLARLWLSRIVRSGAAGSGEEDEVFPGERDAIGLALRRRGLEHWTEVWEKVGRLAASVDGLDLDRRQAILSTLLALDPGHGAAG